MRDLDSRLIFECYKNKLLNEEFNPDVIASKAASLDPQAGREFLHNLKTKDENRFMDVMQKILSGQTASEMVNKFKSEVWPKIKALIGSKSEEEDSLPPLPSEPGDGRPYLKDQDEIDVDKSDLDGDGKLNGYEKKRGAAIDKARGGSGKMPGEDEEGDILHPGQADKGQEDYEQTALSILGKFKELKQFDRFDVNNVLKLFVNLENRLKSGSGRSMRLRKALAHILANSKDPVALEFKASIWPKVKELSSEMP